MARNTTISIVGGGWSFRVVDHAKVPGYIIAVNEAGVLLEKPPKEIVTMDRLWSENRWKLLCELGISSWFRRSAVQNIDWMGEEWAKVYDCDNTSVEFSEVPSTLNGTNSGTCALNLAYICRPRELYLFGFDMCRAPNGEPYWYPPYEWASEKGGTSNGKYNAWAGEFNCIALKFAEIGCSVINVSESSKIRAWRRVSARELGVAK